MNLRDWLNNQTRKIGLTACGLFLLLALVPTECQGLIQVAPVDLDNSVHNTDATQTSERLNLADEEIESLISQLDSASYQQREHATATLARCGPQVLGKLAVHFFQSSSEAGWRINRILEGISRDDDEDVFLKSAAIIRVLFGSNDQKSRRKLQKLQTQRLLKQRQSAVMALAKVGFQVDAQGSPVLEEDPFAARPIPFAAREIFVEGRGRAVFVDGRIVSLTESDQPTSSFGTNPKTWKDPRSNPEDSLSRIETIIENDTDDNRDFLSGILPQGNIVLPPANLVFPKGKVDAKTKSLIAKLGPVSFVQFNGQEITPELIELVASNALQNIDFQNCTFAIDDLQSLPPNVASLSFAGNVPSSDKLFALMNKKYNLRFEGIKLNKALVSAIQSNNVQTLYLQKCRFENANLKAALMSRGLFHVSFSQCKIDVTTINQIRRKRPDLQITAVPQGFLGVQGGPDAIRTDEYVGCRISRVVADSGAEKAGMKAGDVVVEIDGQKIAEFEDLRLLVSQGREGDVLKVKVDRDGKKMDLSVTLSKADSFR